MSTELLDTYPKYESYKDSGIKELGKVPKNWELLSNKHIFSIKNIRVGKKSEDYDLLSLTLKGIVKRDMDNPQGKFPAEFDTYQEVSSGDFVFCLFDVEETPRTVGLSEFDGMITGAYTVLEVSPSFDKNFIYYFYLNLDNEKMLKPLYRGLRNTIPKDWFMSYKTFVPTYKEQTAIARFLDQKMLQIDQAIESKQQQIERLNEYKQIIIQNAVTKGLDPTAKMKDSGVSWIGNIPEEWTIEKGKWLFFKMDRPVREEDGIVTCFRDGEVTLRSNRRTEGFTNALKEHGYQGVRKGDLVIHQMDAFAGAIGVSDSDGKSTPVYSVCIPKDSKRVLSKYYSYFLRSIAHNGYILSLAKGIRERSTDFRFNDFAKLELPLPPYSSQIKISEFIEQQTARINLVTDLQKQQIERLKEYKTILINQAVTGKIKVS
ncbi:MULTISPECIES: restriction endonuclease subunit S [unclassified Psychrobacter]|uniref:restriction endonuclease subunit S n=1 Tax=unclassified Psychrobacter TaxID=196806 RepID=UPI000406C354|nr:MULTISPECIES: restriction endonuclease subunit S [unclassified Psychrobacter]